MENGFENKLLVWRMDTDFISQSEYTDFYHLVSKYFNIFNE